MIEIGNFKYVSRKLFIKLRTSKSMSQKNFGKVIGIKTSTVNKRESEGLLNIVEIYNLCEKIGLDPREKLIEMLEQAESLKTQAVFKIKERNTTSDY